MAVISDSNGRKKEQEKRRNPLDCKVQRVKINKAHNVLHYVNYLTKH
jgi:hypothetical protein